MAFPRYARPPGITGENAAHTLLTCMEHGNGHAHDIVPQQSEAEEAFGLVYWRVCPQFLTQLNQANLIISFSAVRTA